MVETVRRICAVLVDRANYGRMHPVMRAINADADLELLTVCAGTMLLERFGQAEKIVSADGFKIDGRVFLEVEGSIPATMAKSIGLGVIEFSTEFQRLQPDIVLLIGDRYEALAAAIAAAYMNIPIAHIQGGEVSGSIDESARHAITKFAHLHFPSTERSAQFIRRMGERTDSVFNVGCPSGDYIRSLDTELPANLFTKIGVGGALNSDNPFFLVIYHPVTTHFGNERQQVQQLIEGLAELAHPTLWIWPNIDAGADDISKALRTHREHYKAEWLHLVKNLEPITFQKCLKKATCAIGNSSSFIRDSTFSGTPVVLVGERQAGREHGENLTAVRPEKQLIIDAIKAQIAHGRYPVSNLYGEGNASVRIVEKIKNFEPYQQKMLQYVSEY
ncbi:MULTISPECIES: UDP-N-acetylglucosamine 2-epimerase [Rhizobium]|uniref:UDP-N-acetylglucosamine 2-epimerase n=1 Tax=Rhizobium TaxID=379 RepID=UPI001C837CC2|nr:MULTISPECIES: UDP-N-acetylglucosamine 2-epimerase [Rhizobium]MBX4893851.1 UDP-N-acetylglucosamine 2-epimerase (hydrolyzing) [Rhizobium bangladeshense]MBX4917959.1 UDP-N-acetylglucosamine 2-epimerase (hydrolyzing) [Rhizobium bangladeshense]MBX5180748.1 UDP-N-acetylglucosamine 2-epimerase (hydrolyzing) [Rhizobium lentis]